MPTKSSFKKTMLVRSPSATLCLPLVQVNAKGVIFLHHDTPWTYCFRIFRYGSLLMSKASTNFSSIFNIGSLSFLEVPQHLVFDIVVFGYFTPLKHLLVFPLYLNVSWRGHSGDFQIVLPGSVQDDWKANLSAGIKLLALRERRSFRQKTEGPSQISSNFSGGSYGSGS